MTPSAPHPLQGVWTLMEWTAHFSDGTVRAPFGPGATGELTYTETTMAGFLQAATHVNGAWTAFLAYAGPWRVEGDEVVHAVRFSSRPDWVGTEVRRTLRWLPDGTLELTTEPEPTPGGRTLLYRLVWARA